MSQASQSPLIVTTDITSNPRFPALAFNEVWFRFVGLQVSRILRFEMRQIEMDAMPTMMADFFETDEEGLWEGLVIATGLLHSD